MSRFLFILKRTATIVGSMAALTILAVAVYLLLVQPWHLRWGATDDEVQRLLPGDEIMPDPDYECTHAITIHAPREDVWPWLVQIGQDRGGFYSYTWIENLLGMDIHNVDRIVPQWQHLKVGDRVGLAPGNWMTVASTEPGQWVVFDMPLGKQTSWAFVLDRIDARTTRFLIRLRMEARGRAIRYSPFDPGHFIMERKTMLRMKQMAEAASGVAQGQTSSELIWFLSMIVAGLAILALVFTKKWPWTLALASAGVVLWVLVFFRGHPSPVYGAVLVIGTIGALLWACWPQRWHHVARRKV